MSFKFVDQKLHLDQLDISQFCEKQQGAFYLYDLDGIMHRFELFQKALPENASIHYAMKCNSHPDILTPLFQRGYGADLVSGGELKLATQCGALPENILFSGVGKTVREIDAAIDLDIAQINVESPAELKRIIERARAKNKKVNVAFRMNPDVDPVTHPYIKTGFRENKFGMDASFLPELLQILKGGEGAARLVGLTLHIGSQIRDLSPIEEAIRKTLVVFDDLNRDGHHLTRFDVGGGVGINYESDRIEEDHSDIEAYGELLHRAFKGRPDIQIQCEPGRVLLARFGLLLTQVQYIKESPFKSFVIADAGMHMLMRPSLYQAFHRIYPVVEKAGSPKLYDVVGPICESSDVLGRERLFANIQQGDWLAIADTGAYGAVMASDYNLHGQLDEFIYTQGRILNSAVDLSAKNRELE